MAVILNNTILVPTSDSLVSSNPLPETTISKDFETYKTNYDKTDPVFAYEFKVFLKTGEKTVAIPFCQTVRKLEIKRGVEEKRIGGVADYAVKLPGTIQYTPIRLVHLITDNEVFLDWLVNSADLGGIQRADLEIRAGSEKDYMLFTLRDAFPIKWNFGTMTVSVENLVLNEETVTYSMKQGDILIENLDVVYSALEYEHVTG